MGSLSFHTFLHDIFKDNTEPEHKDTETENEDLDAKLAELPTEPQTKK